MPRSQTMRLLAALLTFAVLLVPAPPAYAADGACAPGATCFEAGTACADFDLQIQLGDTGRGIHQEFLSEDGDIVHVLGAPDGHALTFANLNSGATLAFTPDESHIRFMLNPNDTRTEVVTGHSIIVISPLHAPAQPSAMLYAGPVIFDITIEGVFTVWEASDIATDICTALSS